MPADLTYQYTLEDIQRYLSGSMSAPEMHALEKAALNDPLLADALDGYRGAQPSLTAQHLNAIRSQIGNVKQPAAPVVPLPASGRKKWRMLAAAIIVGFMAFGTWLLIRPSEQLFNGGGVAHNAEQPSAPEITAPLSTGKTDSIIAPPLTTNTAPATSLQEKTVVKDIPKKPIAVSPASPAMAPAQANSDADKTDVAANSINNKEIADSRQFSAPQETLRRSSASVNTTIAERDTELVLNNQARIARTNLLTGQPVNGYFIGKVQDQNGNPIPGASITSSENKTTISNTDGSFRIPTNDSIGQLSFIAVGYTNKTAPMLAGRMSGIRLEESKEALNEVVIVGYGTTKKKADTDAAVPYKVDALPYKESPYPQGGWDSFYNQLTTEMGVNKATASKDLHLRFTVEDGTPQNFTVVKSPDAATAQKAISIIKKGPKWRTNKKKKKVDLKIKVD